MKRTTAALIGLVGILFACLYCIGKSQQEPSDKNLSTLVRQGAAQSRISFRLTTPQEFKAIAGQPTKEWMGNRPGTRVNLEYPCSVVSGVLRISRVALGK